MGGGDRPVYFAGFPRNYDATDVKDFLSKRGRVARVDMKEGFAFVYFEDDRDAEDAVHDLNGRDIEGRRVRVEFANGRGQVKRREEERKRNINPNPTLFVVNFDTQRTTAKDLEDAFGRFGRLERVDLRKNFAFVQFMTTEDAKAALAEMNGGKVNGYTITCEYAARESPTYGGGGGGGRGRSRSRTPSPRRRSPSPHRNRRSPSPRRRSPSPHRSRRSPSPRRRSPSPRRR